MSNSKKTLKTAKIFQSPIVKVCRGTFGTKSRIVNICKGTFGVKSRIVKVYKGTFGVKGRIVNICKGTFGVKSRIVKVCKGTFDMKTPIVKTYNQKASIFKNPNEFSCINKKGTQICSLWLISVVKFASILFNIFF